MALRGRSGNAVELAGTLKVITGGESFIAGLMRRLYQVENSGPYPRNRLDAR
jgi:hypothetical protein